MATAHRRDSWLVARSGLHRALVALLVSSMLAVAAPVEAAGPGNAPRPSVPHRNPVQPGSRLVETGPSIRSEAGKTRLEILMAHANKSGQVDPRLRGIQSQFAELGFTGLEVLSTHSDQLAASQSTTIQVAGGRKFEITLLSFDAQQARVRMEMFVGAEKKWDTTIPIRRGGRPMVVAGPPYQQGKLVFTVAVPN